MPGGASNTGAAWIAVDHPGADPGELDRQAATWAPTRLVRYPLVKRGERFPFVHAAAEGFTLGDPASPVEYYAAGLEGVALLERLAYDALQALGLEVGEKIYMTGGGSRSRLWSQVRASALKRALARPAVTETAMGAAILAASGCWYPTLSEAASKMVRIAETIEPNPAWQGIYDENYGRFLDELECRGYV
jgi:sugar (pentulose or hexulose) kinase